MSIRRCLVLVVCAGLLATGCSQSDDTTSPDEDATTSTTAVDARPDGPAADLSEEITGTSAPFVGESTPVDLAEAGYVEQEFVAAGTASSYRADGPLGGDGRWTFEPADEADYRTRVLVRRPAAPEDFSGTVVVEWLNVSGGVDANPDFSSLEEEILRQGHAWVGVSAQLIGVAGGPLLVEAPGSQGLGGEGLRAIDPERYASLDHPGDGYSFDMFTQVARALRGGAGLDDLQPDVVIAAGESQSALALTTYVNGVQPLTEAFDGFLVHSRAAVALPLVGPGEYADLAGSLSESAPTILRNDLDAPVLVLQAEGDITTVLASYQARQPDDDQVRLWEVAGTAHADTHLLGPLADDLECGAAINDGPMHLVAKAALRALDGWVRDGVVPPAADRIGIVEGDDPEIERDPDGIALGGIRTPPVDVPVDALSGEPGPNPALLCLLLGSTTPLPAERLAELYPSVADYEDRYAEALDAAVDGGWLLEADREAALAFADPTRIAG